MEGHFLLARIERVPNAHGAVIEDTDDIARVGIFDNRPFRREELLWLHETQCLTGLTVRNGHAFFEFPGANAHENDAVMVLRVHVRLNLKDERRKLV